MPLIIVYLIGLLFGLGIVVGGMANPAKVLNFFDFAGTWDPSLIFVMGGALAVTVPGYALVTRRSAPLFDARFQIPTKRDLDVRLIGGSALFGLGWGIAGFCPGGALPALGTGRVEVVVFVAAMICGIILARTISKISGARPTPMNPKEAA
ncbi:MAG: YeeE/YedE family protein [Alphaproteobacteria bacterium]|nr:YeeE/YedE family protein [Alphaproteobacteria bacterium]